MNLRCLHRPLSQNSSGAMELCVRCRTIHLHLGPVSLRVAPDEVENIWLLVAEGLSALRAHQETEVHTPHVS